jgi:uncharacterized repeat protein (TIGR03803 family)
MTHACSSLVMVALIFALPRVGAAEVILHDFVGGSSDGSNPNGSLTLSGSELFGMTSSGNFNNGGTIFEENTNGTGYNILVKFSYPTGSSIPGASPDGSLTLSGSTLYGMTSGGGANGLGVIFSVSTSGSGYTLRDDL